MILKAKIYLKPGEKPPEGARVQRGPKGGLYYEAKIKVKPKKVPNFNDLSASEKSSLIPKLNQADLHILISDDDEEVRFKVAEHVEQSGLHRMITDKSDYVRFAVAKHIDQSGLHEMINDKDTDVRGQIVERIDQSGVHEMRNDKVRFVRFKVAQRANQSDLHEMLDDEEHVVRIEVARRIDQSGLHKMINDEHELVRKQVATRINQSGLHEMMDDEVFRVREEIVKRIDIEGLEKLKLDGAIIGAKAIARLRYIKKIADVTKHFKDTGKIKLNNHLKNLVSKIITKDTTSISCIELIDEFYTQIGYGSFHKSSKSDWESSSSSPLAGLLKDSIMRQFGGKIQHHDEITDWDNFTSELYKIYDKSMVDEYVKIHKELTRQFLDIMHPDQEKIKLYRGTTSREIADVDINEHLSLQSNCLSSWTSKKSVAKKFANKENGLAFNAVVDKNDIWSTFLSHAYQGNEREFLIVSPKDRTAVAFYNKNIEAD